MTALEPLNRIGSSTDYATLLKSATSQPVAEDVIFHALELELAARLLIPIEDIDEQKRSLAPGIDSLVALEVR